METIKYRTPLGYKDIPASVATCPNCDKLIPHTEEIHTAIWDCPYDWILYPCPHCKYIVELFYNRHKQLDLADPANQ